MEEYYIISFIPIYLQFSVEYTSVCKEDLFNILVTLTEPTRKIHVYEGPAPAPSKLAIPPARNPSSRVIVIWNLVRPFTPNQLRELLLRTGRLAEGGFWLDNIKSTCLAMVSFNGGGVLW